MTKRKQLNQHLWSSLGSLIMDQNMDPVVQTLRSQISRRFDNNDTLIKIEYIVCDRIEEEYEET